MNENNNPQNNQESTDDRPQPPKRIGRPDRTDLINPQQQAIVTKLSENN